MRSRTVHKFCIVTGHAYGANDLTTSSESHLVHFSNVGVCEAIDGVACQAQLPPGLNLLARQHGCRQPAWSDCVRPPSTCCCSKTTSHCVCYRMFSLLLWSLASTPSCSLPSTSTLQTNGRALLILRPYIVRMTLLPGTAHRYQQHLQAYTAQGTACR